MNSVNLFRTQLIKYRPQNAFKVVLCTNQELRPIHTTSLCSLDAKWRREQGLSLNPNAYGPLTNLPDYTFLDGRPTPLGSRQKKRVLEQRENAKRIVTLCREMNAAKEHYQQLQRQKLEEKQQIINNKLKPKGHLLLKKK